MMKQILQVLLVGTLIGSIGGFVYGQDEKLSAMTTDNGYVNTARVYSVDGTTHGYTEMQDIRPTNELRAVRYTHLTVITNVYVTNSAHPAPIPNHLIEYVMNGIKYYVYHDGTSATTSRLDLTP